MIPNICLLFFQFTKCHLGMYHFSVEKVGLNEKVLYTIYLGYHSYQLNNLLDIIVYLGTYFCWAHFTPFITK